MVKPFQVNPTTKLRSLIISGLVHGLECFVAEIKPNTKYKITVEEIQLEYEDAYSCGYLNCGEFHLLGGKHTEAQAKAGFGHTYEELFPLADSRITREITR